MMTVKDLMNLLATFDANMPVDILFDGGCGGGAMTPDCVMVDERTGTLVLDADEAA